MKRFATVASLVVVLATVASLVVVLSVPFGKPTVKSPVRPVEAFASPVKGSLGGTVYRASNARLAALMARSVGWEGKQWDCLRSLWNAESRFNHLAVNEKSGAYGIPQAMKIPNRKFKFSAEEQIKWGLKYISFRYPAGPCEAWTFHKKNGWY